MSAEEKDLTDPIIVSERRLAELNSKVDHLQKLLAASELWGEVTSDLKRLQNVVSTPLDAMIWICISCHKHCATVEMLSRNLNPGRCVCGGTLYLAVTKIGSGLELVDE